MTDSAHLVSIQQGKIQTFKHADGAWTTGFHKTPVQGEVRVGIDGLEGDDQADKRYHGGADKALLAYSIDHTSFWQEEYGLAIPYGGFGENLSIENLTELDVCIGDRWSFGNVLLEVSQPRQPCWKLGRRWDRKDLPKLVIQNGRSGWYFRVVELGFLVPQQIKLVDRPFPNWSIQRANEVFYGKHEQHRSELAALPSLAESWKSSLSKT